MESAYQVLLHAVPESEEEDGPAGWLAASAMCWRVFLNPHSLTFDRGQSACQVLLHAFPESEEEEDGSAGWLTASAMGWRFFSQPSFTHVRPGTRCVVSRIAKTTRYGG